MPSNSKSRSNRRQEVANPAPLTGLEAHDMFFHTLLREELANARSKHRPYHSLHEAYAIILEELDELWDQVRLKSSARRNAHILVELIQIASTAQRTATELLMVGRDVPSAPPKNKRARK